MAILAAAVRYDLKTKQRQAVIVITDDDGRGHPDHLIPHKAEAQFRGEGWLEIPQEVYASFNNPSAATFGGFAPTLDAHIAKILGS